MLEILTKDQKAVLSAIGNDSYLPKHFYLTGGTPLAAFYLHHRYSEDLDFFSEGEVDLPSLTVFFKKIKSEIGFSALEYQSTLNRHLYFLKFESGLLKMEFTYFPFPRIQKGASQFGIEIDSLFDIAVNKLFTIYQRTKARDYIDLFLICRQEGFSIVDLVKHAMAKFDWHIDPIQLGTQFVRSQEASDFPRMITPVAGVEWQGFFLEEAKKLKTTILE